MWLKRLSDSVETGIGAALARLATGYLCHHGWELPYYVVGECNNQCHFTYMLSAQLVIWAYPFQWAQNVESTLIYITGRK